MTLGGVDKPRIERITRMKRSNSMIAIVRVAAQSLNRGKFGLNYLYDSGDEQSASGSRQIPLDFCQNTTDTAINVLAAPLLRTVKCPRNDVHHRRVFLCPNRKLLITSILWEVLL